MPLQGRYPDLKKYHKSINQHILQSSYVKLKSLKLGIANFAISSVLGIKI